MRSSVSSTSSASVRICSKRSSQSSSSVGSLCRRTQLQRVVTADVFEPDKGVVLLVGSHGSHCVRSCSVSCVRPSTGESLMTVYGLGAGCGRVTATPPTGRVVTSRPGGCGRTASTLPRARRVRSLQAVGHRPREPQDDARPLPGDQEPARLLRRQGPGVLLTSACARKRGLDDGRRPVEGADHRGRRRLAAAAAGPQWPLMFHESGGCCDGSSPICYPDGEFIVGDRDILLSILDVSTENGGSGVPVWISGPSSRRGNTPNWSSTWCPGAAAASASRHPRACGF